LQFARHERERVDVTRLERCEVMLSRAAMGIELAAFDERDPDASTTHLGGPGQLGARTAA
jgi:hypothetical protein